MAKMKLYYSPGSPYARKVRVMAMETGLDRKIEMVNVVVSPIVPNADVDMHNPIGKIPALAVKGMNLFDSPLIWSTSTASTKAASSCRARAASAGWRSGCRQWPTGSSMPPS